MNKTEEIVLKFLQDDNKISADNIEKIKNSDNGKNWTLIDTIVSKQILSEKEFIEILANLFRKNRISVDDILNDLGVETAEILSVVGNIYKLEYYDLDNIDIDYRIAEKTNISQLKKFNALPIKEDDISVYVALKSPFDIIVKDGVQNLFSRKLLKVVLADPIQIERYIGKLELNESIKDLIAEIRHELSNNTGKSQNEQSSGILKLIEVILKTAISQRASDIHIEPTSTNCIVRSRIDGMLNETFIFDKDIYAPMASRLKLLANMDIAERRKPQDGRFSLQILKREYDFRISTLPIINGESVVLRILDKARVIVDIKNLGMSKENLDKFQNSMRSPYGIVLVTGPTGSGKTTTLYAGLNEIKSIKTKIITVEDPVEYQLSLIQQVQINEKAGLGFANSLRSILRQDPDIIMIGEIRDKETLRIAVSAALTGHLVFSTLHTNDAISAITRIVDMGIEPYLVGGALVLVSAQRLIRKLCPYCKSKTTLSHRHLDEIAHLLPKDYQFYTPVGCSYCSRTGYLGREMIGETLNISNSIQTLIINSASKDEIRNLAIKEGFKDMFSDALFRAANGQTSIEEVYRVAKI